MAERKILSMSFVLGIPEQLKNLSVVNNYYKKLTISKNYFNNVLTLRKFYKLKEFEAVKKDEFKSSSVSLTSLLYTDLLFLHQLIGTIQNPFQL